MTHPERDLSLVIPLFNEEESLETLYTEIAAALTSWPDHEIIFVDDGSTDGSRAVLERLSGFDPKVRVITFRRNFGKAAALDAAFRRAGGRYVVTLDADLQDDPAEIPLLIDHCENEQLDLVSGWKKVRHDPWTKRIPSKFWNALTRLISGLTLHDFNCGLKLYRREVVAVLRVHGDLHRYLPVLAHWAGFRVGEKPVNHRPRRFGRTKYTGPGRFVRGFLDLITVKFLNRYVSSPLHFFGVFGFLLLAAGVVLNIYLLMEKIQGRGIGDRPLLFLAVMLVIVGVQFISFGLLGEMMAREPKEGITYQVENLWGFDPAADAPGPAGDSPGRRGAADDPDSGSGPEESGPGP